MVLETNINKKDMIRSIRNRPFPTVLVGVALPGLFTAVLEYWLLDGHLGLTPIYSAVAGGLAATICWGIIRKFVETDDDSPVAINEESMGIYSLRPTSPINQQVGGRILSPRSRLELVEEARGKTSIARNHAISRHLGQWIRVNGNVLDVEEWSEGVHVCFAEADGEPFTSLCFENSKWRPVLASLNPGDEIDVIGKIERITQCFSYSQRMRVN